MASELTLALAYLGTATSHLSDAIDWQREEEKTRNPERRALAVRRRETAEAQAKTALERARNAVEGEQL